MSKDNIVTVRGDGIFGSFLFLLFVVFLVLKLTGNVDWSWWIVTLPLWIPFAIPLGIFAVFATLVFSGLLVYFILLGLAALFDEYENYRWRNKRKEAQELRRARDELLDTYTRGKK